MNDCIWGYISAGEGKSLCQECCGCDRCPKYIGSGTEKWNEIYEKYTDEIEEALKPLAKSWKEVFDNYEI